MSPGQYCRHAFGEARRTVGRHGYTAFFPAHLPCTLDLAATTVTTLADAEAAIGRLDAISQLLPSPGMLTHPSLVREAVASTRIEGTQASARDVYDLDASERPPSPDVEEVVNAIQATEHALARLRDLPICVRLVCEAHEILLAGARGRDRRPGEVRTSQNWIGAPGSTLATASYVPPPPGELPGLLADWERFANERLPGMPVLAQCALLHYQFEAIHPFLDGNGRAGRLLITVFLVARERLARPVLTVSAFFEHNRDEYISRLQAVHERGEIDAWVRFFCEGLRAEANAAFARASRLRALRDEFLERVPVQRNAQALVSLLFEHPVLNARIVERRLAVSRPTALRLLSVLADAGVLVERPAGLRAQRSWEARELLRALDVE